MSVRITSYVDAQAGGNDKIYLQVPSGVGSISITDVFGLQGALDGKLNDTLGVVGATNVTATGDDLNSIAGITATGIGVAEFTWLVDVFVTGVTPVEVGHSVGLTGNIQSQLDSKYDATDFGALWEIIAGTGAGTATITSFASALNAHAISELATATAAVDMGGFKITDLLDPTDPQDAATMNYVDLAVGAVGGPFLQLAGGTMTGDIMLDGADIVMAAGELVDGRDVSADGSTLDTHTGDATIHRAIDDLGTGTTDLWSADKIIDELASKSDTSHTHTVLDLTDTPGSYTGHANKALVVNGTADGVDFVDTTTFVPVDSVFGRTGAVVAQNGDYNASAITNIPAGDVSAVTVQAAINELDSEKAAIASLAAVATSGSYGDLSGTPTVPGDFTDLGDTPSSYAGHALELVRVNSGTTDLEFVAASTVAPVDSVFGRTGAVVAAASDYDADQVDYDNGSSGLTATDVQAAIDEVEGRVDVIEAAGPFVPLDGSVAMTGDLDLGGNGIVNLSTLDLGNHVFNPSDYESAEGGQSFFVRTTATPGASTPTYSFLNEQNTGWYHDSSNMKATRQGTDVLELNADGLDVKTGRVQNMEDPSAPQDGATKAYVDGLMSVRKLFLVTSVDLTSSGIVAVLGTVPTGKRHIYSQILFRARTYTPGGSPTAPVVSIGISGLYEQVIRQVPLDWGSSGSADQSLVVIAGQDQSGFLPATGPSVTPNPGDTLRLNVNTPAGHSALTVDVYVLGIEFDA